MEEELVWWIAEEIRLLERHRLTKKPATRTSASVMHVDVAIQ